MANQFGGSGNDTFVGGAGSDNLMGQGGDDSVDGAGGNDFIYGGDGNDRLAGGDGHDRLYGGEGDDTLEGGGGNDTLMAEGGDDTVYGGAGDDTAYGHAGMDDIEGGDGNDIVFGDGGNDLVKGDAGNDTVYGGDGDDRVDGGTGDDTLYGGNGADVFVTSEGGGDDVIVDFKPAEGDILEINYPGVSSFDDLKPYMSDDGNWGTMITFPDGTSTHLQYYNFETKSANDFRFESGPICFLRGTLIDTPDGETSIERLRVGDHVTTLDDGPQPIRFISHSRFRFGPGPHPMKPMRIKAGALALGCPARDLIVSPQHRIALPQDRPACLIPAKKMQGLPGVSARPGCRSALYYHLLLDRHALIRASGAWAESMRLTTYSANGAHVPKDLRGPDMPLVRPDWRKRPQSDWATFLGLNLA